MQDAGGTGGEGDVRRVTETDRERRRANLEGLAIRFGSFGRVVQPVLVHLQGGEHDGVHVSVLSSDRRIRVGSYSGPVYRRTLVRDRRHGCGLRVLKITSADLGYLGALPSGVMREVHLEGGPHDGVHVRVYSAEASIRIASPSAPVYIRTLRRDASHGCQLPIYQIAGPITSLRFSRYWSRRRGAEPPF